jgi:vesicle coat complex subunit
MNDGEGKKGEIYELKAELNSDKRDRKKEAVKKVIASMTVGKDVSQLFPDVVNCMQTDNLELKKLVYLYLMNYAKTQPEMAILAVNTFAKDCNDPNPLIRALAVRTMGCIRVDKITEHLCEPLRKCLKDEDPYVRKTAAVCVAKLYDINQHLVDDQGFLDMLRDLLSDSNPMVVANAVAALSEISEQSLQTKIFDLNGPTVNKLLTALNECTEWGQVFILDAIANYSPKDDKEAQSICERITPRLAHSNSAVVLSTVKVLMKFLELIDQHSEFVQNLYRKLAPPLVTLLSSEPEIQYVALRNINLIVQKRSDILKNEMKVFFVKYNDPIYVKLEKLDIMIRLTNANNIAQVLSELKEYATEVDVDFVRKAVRAIGRCAIKVEQAAERCVSTLIDLIQTKVNYVVQEAIVVIKDIFRKYPNKYESIIATLCENLDSLDEPEARASMIWIVGEYAERIDNADELLEGFLDGFKDENNQVQLQLLTAIVKLFLKKPTDTPQQLVTRVLTLVTQETDNPDLRDRGYIYWRLLSTDPKAAKEVVLAEKPLISEETDLLEPTLLDELICHIGTLASVYHKPPNAFVEGRLFTAKKNLPLRSGVNNDGEHIGNGVSHQDPVVISNNVGSLIDDDFNILGPMSNAPPTTVDIFGQNQQRASSAIPNFLDEELSSILGTDSTMVNTQTSMGNTTTSLPMNNPSTTSSGNLLDDLFGDLNLTTGVSGISFSGNNTFALPKEIWLTAQKGKGLEVSGTFTRRNNQITMELDFTNKALQPMNDFALQLNRNSFGLTPTQPLHVTSPLFPNQTVSTQLILNTTGPIMKIDPLTNLQIAIKNNIDVFYLNALVPIYVYFVNDGEMDKMTFVQTWQDIPESNEVKHQLQNTNGLSVDDLQNKLRLNNIHTITRTIIEQKEMLYQTIKLTNGIFILVELKITPGSRIIAFSLKTRVLDVANLIVQAYELILNSN